MKIIRKKAFPKGYKFSEEENKLYIIFNAMHQRCEDRNHQYYCNYGGKGIYVCDEWFNFKNFCEWATMSGYKIGLTIDRINGAKVYSPNTCRWLTQKEQNQNKENTIPVIQYNEQMEIVGKFKTAAEAHRETGASETSIRKCCRGEQKFMRIGKSRKGNPRYTWRYEEK